MGLDASIEMLLAFEDQVGIDWPALSGLVSTADQDEVADPEVACVAYREMLQQFF